MVIKGNGGEGKSQIGAVLSGYLWHEYERTAASARFLKTALPVPIWNTSCCAWMMICGWKPCARPTM